MGLKIQASKDKDTTNVCSRIINSRAANFLFYSTEMTKGEKARKRTISSTVKTDHDICTQMGQLEVE